VRIGREAAMAGVYDILRDRAYERSAYLEDDAFLVKGLWKVDLAFKPNVHERIFRYSFLVAQTMGQGCCYCDKDLEIDSDLIGKDAREIVRTKDCFSIAVLDSIFASIERDPQAVHKLEGNSVEKAGKRALYRTADPFLRMWFRVVAPHRAILARASRKVRLELWKRERERLFASRRWFARNKSPRSAARWAIQCSAMFERPLRS